MLGWWQSGERSLGRMGQSNWEVCKVIEPTHVITYSYKHTEEINKHDHVGLWVITSSFRIRVRTKPNWFHRQMARILLGWKWEDRK